MPNIGSILKLLKYAPMVMQVVQGMRAKQQPETARETAEMHHELADFKKVMQDRMQALEEENARLRARVKDVDANLATLRALIYIGGTALLLLTLALFVAMLVRG